MATRGIDIDFLRRVPLPPSTPPLLIVLSSRESIDAAQSQMFPLQSSDAFQPDATIEWRLMEDFDEFRIDLITDPVDLPGQEHSEFWS